VPKREEDLLGLARQGPEREKDDLVPTPLWGKKKERRAFLQFLKEVTQKEKSTGANWLYNPMIVETRKGHPLFIQKNGKNPCLSYKGRGINQCGKKRKK